jgi:hypothetical protein
MSKYNPIIRHVTRCNKIRDKTNKAFRLNDSKLEMQLRPIN